MTTRSTDSLAIVARARRIAVPGSGWRVSQVGDGYKITCPDKVPVVVHLTYSSRNSLAAVERELNAHGFADAEKAFEAQLEERRLARLAAEKARSEKAIAAASSRRTAVARAAGPYGPSDVTLDELLAKHPAPRFYQRVRVTPEMAKVILDEHNHRNRRPSPAETAEYAAKLRSGRAQYIPHGAAFDVDGELLDGQTRFAAILETGIACEMVISVGWPPEVFKVLDTGRRRTPSQILGLAGASSATVVAVVARLLYLYGLWADETLSHTKDRIANDLIADTYAKLDGDDLTYAVRVASRVRAETGQSPTGIAAALYLIRQTAGIGGQAEVDKFADDLVNGGRRDADPVFAVHRRFQRASRAGAERITPAEAMALVIKGWNGRLLGEKPEHIRITAASKMPVPLLPATA